MVHVNHGRHDFILHLTPEQVQRIRELADWFNAPSVEVAELHAPGMNLRHILRERILNHFLELMYQRSAESAGPITVRLHTADGGFHELPVSEASFETQPLLQTYDDEYTSYVSADFGFDVETDPEVLRTMDGTIVWSSREPGSQERYGHAHWPEPRLPRNDEERQTWIGAAEEHYMPVGYEWTEPWIEQAQIRAAVAEQMGGDELNAASRLAAVEDTLAEATEWERSWESYASRPQEPTSDTRSLIEAAREYATRDPGDPVKASGLPHSRTPVWSEQEDGWVQCGPGCSVCQQ